MKDKDSNFYTRLTYEHKSVEDFGPKKVILEETAWDLGGSQMMDMFFKIWVAAGFIPDGFTGQCKEWIEQYEPVDLIEDSELERRARHDCDKLLERGSCHADDIYEFYKEGFRKAKES